MPSLPSWRWGPSCPRSRRDWGSCSAPQEDPGAHSAGRRNGTSSETSAQGWDLKWNEEWNTRQYVEVKLTAATYINKQNYEHNHCCTIKNSALKLFIGVHGPWQGINDIRGGGGGGD